MKDLLHLAPWPLHLYLLLLPISSCVFTTGLVKVQEGIKHSVFCSFCLEVFLLPFAPRNLQDAQCHPSGMLFPNKADFLLWDPTAPGSQLFQRLCQPPHSPRRGSLTRLSQPDPSPLEIFNYEALSQWELEVRSYAIIKACMVLRSAYFVPRPVLGPLPSSPYFKPTTVLQSADHCVPIIQTRRLVHREDDVPPTVVPTEAAPVHESRVLL